MIPNEPLGPEMTALLSDYRDPDDVTMREVEQDMLVQLRNPQAMSLKLLGHGGFSVAFAYPPQAPRWALKRLPPAKERYVREHKQLIERYVVDLAALGVRVLHTSCHMVPSSGGRHALYVAQPILRPETLLPEVLARRSPDPDDEVMTAVLAALRRGTTPSIGTDGNFANWGWIDGEPWQFDVTTPWLTDAAGRPELDPTMMIQPYFVLARPYLRHAVAPDLLRRYHDFRGAASEAIGLLKMHDVPQWIPAAVEIANRFLDDDFLTVEGTIKAYEENRAMEGLVYVLQRMQALALTMTGQTYQFLMPPKPKR